MHPVIKENGLFARATAAESVTLSAEEAALAHELLAKLLGAAEPATLGDMAATTAAPATVTQTEEQQAIALARSVYQSRRRRAEHFGPALFSEPAWDMLLVLFIYGGRGDRTSVSKLAEFSQSPLTTAIRWLDYLESQRMIVRTQCEHDRRKFFVSLSDKGSRMMTDYFVGLIKTGMAS
jgi:DNA-binding MarR family transcriptional regulator